MIDAASEDGTADVAAPRRRACRPGGRADAGATAPCWARATRCGGPSAPLERRARLLPGRRHRSVLRPISRPACSARSPASPACRSSRASTAGRWPAPASRRAKAAGASTISRHGPRCRCSTPSWRPCASRSRARWRPRRELLDEPALRDRLRRRDRDADRRLARRRPGRAWRRSTSTSTATATSRSLRSRRWPARCWRRSPGAWNRTGACRAAGALRAGRQRSRRNGPR